MIDGTHVLVAGVFLLIGYAFSCWCYSRQENEAESKLAEIKAYVGEDWEPYGPSTAGWCEAMQSVADIIEGVG